MEKTTILVVDDDRAVLKSLEAVLTHSGFEVSAVSSVADALELIGRQQFDVLLADLNIGEPGDGFTVVSAMRRVQPRASAFILTGYPDIETAIKAIRSQVDDYFAKPLNIQELLDSITAVRNGHRRPPKGLASQKLSEFLRNTSPSICDRWYEQVMRDEELAALPLTREERLDHVPELLEDLVDRLQSQSDVLSIESSEAARHHGRTRFQQGYTIPQILFESRVLQRVISVIIQENLLTIELSTLAHDILAIGESLQAEVEISIRAYQGQAPRSLQSSFSMLYRSPHLGVVIADENRVIDANDAFLSMTGYTRDHLTRGEIDWRAMTPEQYRPLDAAVVSQLREFGACAPFEKEFVLSDGNRLPFLIGAIRLTADPLQWSAYVVNLTEQRRAHEAERKIREWETRYSLINRLAHEVNNPLAGLVFTCHLIRTHPDLSRDMAKLVDDAEEMLKRISTTVQKVLIESQQ